MCEKCDELDKKIERYRRLSRQTTDRPTLDGIERLIAQYLSEKIGFHAGSADEN